jgi:predicted transcriptional regulator YheO
MDNHEFFDNTMRMIQYANDELTSYSVGDELTGMEATLLWQALGKLHSRMGEVKNKAQDNDPAFQD